MSVVAVFEFDKLECLQKQEASNSFVFTFSEPEFEFLKSQKWSLSCDVKCVCRKKNKYIDIYTMYINGMEGKISRKTNGRLSKFEGVEIVNHWEIEYNPQ